MGRSSEGEMHDSHRILLILKYGHAPEGIPLGMTATCRRVMDLVERADGRAVSQSPVSTASATAAVARVLALLPQMVRDMAVGGTGRPDAFYQRGERSAAGVASHAPTTPEEAADAAAAPQVAVTDRPDSVTAFDQEEVLLVLEARFREALKQYLEERYQRALELWRKRTPGAVHPAWPPLAEALLEAGAMLPSARGVRIDPVTKLLSARVHNVNFRGVWPLSMPWLRATIGRDETAALTRHWAALSGFTIRAIAPGVAIGDDELEKLAAPRVAKAAAAPTAAPISTVDACPACREPMKVAGEWLVCIGRFRGTCRVRYALRDGKPVTNCSGCGSPLRVVRPRDQEQKPFIGCDKHCGKSGKTPMPIEAEPADGTAPVDGAEPAHGPQLAGGAEPTDGGEPAAVAEPAHGPEPADAAGSVDGPEPADGDKPAGESEEDTQ